MDRGRTLCAGDGAAIAHTLTSLTAPLGGRLPLLVNAPVQSGVGVNAGGAQIGRQALGAFSLSFSACVLCLCSLFRSLGALLAGRDDHAVAVTPAQPGRLAALILSAPQRHAQADVVEPCLIRTHQMTTSIRINAQRLATLLLPWNIHDVVLNLHPPINPQRPVLRVFPTIDVEDDLHHHRRRYSQMKCERLIFFQRSAGGITFKLRNMSGTTGS